MENIKKELINMMERKTKGFIKSSSLTNKEITLLALKKEIEKTRQIRNKIIELFEKDIFSAIDSLNFNYLNATTYPVLLDYQNLFKDKKLMLKLYTDNYIYANCLFSENGLESSDIESLEVVKMAEVMKKNIKKFLQVSLESNVLNNEFYDEVKVLIYNKYIKEMFISGNGIKISLENLPELNSYQKLEILHLYYDHLKKILMNIQVPDVLEFANYKSNISKQKALEIYRG